MTCTCGGRPAHVHHVRHRGPKVKPGRGYQMRVAQACDRFDESPQGQTVLCGQPITDIDIAHHQARHKNYRAIACSACLAAFDETSAP